MKVQIIIGSTRPGRRSHRLANWVQQAVQANNNITAEILDLRDYDLPHFNEAASPRYNPARTPTLQIKKWLDKLQEADAYIIVTPEYNHSIPGVLKNALDYTDFQVARKPFAIVSHGTTGGARAAEHLKGIISEIQAVTIPNNIAFLHRIDEVLDEQGNLDPSVSAAKHGPQEALQHTISELGWYAAALKAAQ